MGRLISTRPSPSTGATRTCAYARGPDGPWGMYQWRDRAARGRNEARTEDAPLTSCSPRGVAVAGA